MKVEEKEGWSVANTGINYVRYRGGQSNSPPKTPTS